MSDRATTAGTEPVMRGRCACGRRFRIVHPQAGLVVNCPACQRAITITETDLRGHDLETQFIPLQADTEKPREALLIDHGELRLAAAGSVIGATGRMVENHEEALLNHAMRGWKLQEHRTPTWITRLVGDKVRGAGLIRILESPVVTMPRSFIADVAASFYFAGSAKNALNLALTALAFIAPIFLSGILGFPVNIFLLPFVGIVMGYAGVFLWSLVTITAGGDDEIPWVPETLSGWGDFVAPFLATALVALACLAPALAVAWLVPDTNPARPLVIALAMAGGSFVWPGLTMAVAVGGFVMLFRPDWVLWSIVRVGPAYLVAWFVVMTALLGMALGKVVAEMVKAKLIGVGLPVGQYVMVAGSLSAATFTLHFYFGYVMYRTIGLIYRHYHQRFPWEW